MIVESGVEGGKVSEVDQKGIMILRIQNRWISPHPSTTNKFCMETSSELEWPTATLGRSGNPRNPVENGLVSAVPDPGIRVLGNIGTKSSWCLYS